MHSSHPLELFPGRTVTLMLFKCVRNPAELRRSAMGGQITAALINPKMLVDPFQVIVAANKAVHLQTIGKMKTRSLNSEIIFNLSPTNNISEAFKRFGISDADDSVLVVLVATGAESQTLADIKEKVDGEQVPMEELPTLSDVTQIRKLYKVTPQEEKMGGLLDSVVCKMATKDVM
ncbi:EKC/KEOPS complex subunit TPRKB [Gadus chalcogrammus]|uniref:EKC/KEOPS complex subunit TPRKB n=1 Tax=Gadus chalcogrammus TaxID=1042646 RepID=UPI0024C4E432|nr:EKC/KEOPS complex subunit TPRKB [Gadus chalcogrammus]XP_056434300.1 EKC/KEOPS complex subunit TPRKB [Gadus chalcogrammus]